MFRGFRENMLTISKYFDSTTFEVHSQNLNLVLFGLRQRFTLIQILKRKQCTKTPIMLN